MIPRHKLTLSLLDHAEITHHEAPPQWEAMGPRQVKEGTDLWTM